MSDILTSADIVGAWAILPTPATDAAADWRAQNTVDLTETARIVEALIASGVDGILSLGTYGECATLTWEEKRSFIATVVETVRGRVPFFAGTTALNTREVVRQNREVLDLGVDGTMLGLPMWCQMELPTAVQFYKDVVEATPDLPICIYANAQAFKFAFPRPFWAEVGKLRQVVASKYLNIAQLALDLDLAPSIRFMPNEGDFYAAARLSPEQCTAFWSSGALCGPATAIRLRDEVRAAVESHDWSGAKAVSDDMHAADRTFFPMGDFAEFSKYNVGIEKERMNAAGWLRAGPCRPPYHVMPAAYREGAQISGRAWAALHAKYQAADERARHHVA